MSNLARTTLAIERPLLDDFDSWMSDHGYSNRSEAMRDLIRGALVQAEWADPNADVIAVLSLVFDHTGRSLAQELTEVQHTDYQSIMCSQHVHLDSHRCLEVILLRGKAGKLRGLGEKIMAARGVRTGKLTLLSRKL